MTELSERLPALPRRFALLITDPARLFSMLGKEPVYWGALLVGALLTSVASALVPLEMWEEMARLQALESDMDLPGDPALFARVAKVAAVFGPIIFWPILALIMAGVSSLVFLFGMGYEGRFQQHFSIVSHALLVAAVAGLLLMPLRIFTGDPAFSISLADLFFVREGFLHRFLGLMEIFNLWVYVLLGVGAWALDPRRSLGISIGVALGVAALFSLLVAAFTG